MNATSDKTEDLRRHPRLALRLPVQTRHSYVKTSREYWTANISAGGMYLTLDIEDTPRKGASLRFSLEVPPGESYWTGQLLIDANGKVARVDDLDPKHRGVAVQFTTPLSLRFLQ